MIYKWSKLLSKGNTLYSMLKIKNINTNNPPIPRWEDKNKSKSNKYPIRNWLFYTIFRANNHITNGYYQVNNKPKNKTKGNKKIDHNIMYYI